MTSRNLWTVAVTMAVAVIAIGMIDRGVALECQFCIGIDSCGAEEIEPVNCTHEIVHMTNASLASFLPTLVYAPRIEGDEFKCVHVRATSLTYRTFLFIRGCVYATSTIQFCDLRYASFRGTRECMACDQEDLCNDVIISGGQIPGGADGLLGAFNIVGSLGLMFATGRWITPIGLLAVGSSLYLMARGMNNLFDVNRFGGLHVARSTFLNVMMTVWNLCSSVFASFPYSAGLTQLLSVPSMLLLGGCAAMNLVWMLTQQPIHTNSWWNA